MTELIDFWLLASTCWAAGFVSAGVLIDARKRDDEE